MMTRDQMIAKLIADCEHTQWNRKRSLPQLAVCAICEAQGIVATEQDIEGNIKVSIEKWFEDKPTLSEKTDADLSGRLALLNTFMESKKDAKKD